MSKNGTSENFKVLSGQVNIETELQEIHSYVRHHFQLLVAWFTFFCTSNYVAMGWFASLQSEGKLKNSTALIAVGIFFAVQNVLGLIVSYYALQHFQMSSQRETTVLQRMERVGVTSALPIAFYKRVIVLLVLALATFLVMWLVLILLPSPTPVP